jgi:hypothetical protein
MCSFLVSVVFAIGAIIGQKNVRCTSDTQGSRQEDLGFCLFQSIFAFYFGLSATCWWCCQALDLYFRLVRELPASRAQGYLTYYHIFSWGLPLVSITAMLTENYMGFSSPSVWCFANGVDEPLWHAYVVLYGPTAVMLACGVGWTGAVVVKIVKTTSRLGGFGVSKRPTRGNHSTSRSHCCRGEIGGGRGGGGGGRG